MKKIMLFLFSISLALTAIGQTTYSKERKLHKSFRIVSGTSLEIVNKYGDIIFNTWEKDSIRIDVEIKAQSEKQENVDQLMELAVVDLDQKGSYIIATTDWGKNSSFWNKSLNDISRTFGADQKIEINYAIYLPNHIAIDVTNKFGDVYLPPFMGDTRIDVSHGDLRCRKLANPKEIKVSYGKALLDDIKGGRINLDFAELRNKMATDLKIISRSSEIYIEKATTLTFDSKNDDIYIGEIWNLKGNFNFSTNVVQTVLNSTDLNSSYGSLEIKNLGTSFTNISINPTRSTVTLNVSKSLNFNFSVYLKNGEEFGSVPELITITNDEKTEDGRRLEGSWGKANPTQKVNITGERAVIKIAKL